MFNSCLPWGAFESFGLDCGDADNLLFILGSQRVVNKINRPIQTTTKPSGTGLTWYQSHETRGLCLVRIRIKLTRVKSLNVVFYYSLHGINKLT